MGTKGKFWYRDTSYGMALFKKGRPGTGEDWAEKVACELAQLMALPHAHYELATCGERRGVIGLSLVHGDARLVHGNEVLSSFVLDYGQDDARIYQQREHTLRRVVSYFKSSEKSIGVPDGFQPRNGSWTRPNGPSWGCAGKARQRSGLLPARWSNAPSAPELDIFSGSVGRVALSPNR